MSTNISINVIVRCSHQPRSLIKTHLFPRCKYVYMIDRDFGCDVTVILLFIRNRKLGFAVVGICHSFLRHDMCAMYIQLVQSMAWSGYGTPCFLSSSTVFFAPCARKLSEFQKRDLGLLPLQWERIAHLWRTRMESHLRRENLSRKTSCLIKIKICALRDGFL